MTRGSGSKFETEVKVMFWDRDRVGFQDGGSGSGFEIGIHDRGWGRVWVLKPGRDWSQVLEPGLGLGFGTRVGARFRDGVGFRDGGRHCVSRSGFGTRVRVEIQDSGWGQIRDSRPGLGLGFRMGVKVGVGLGSESGLGTRSGSSLGTGV
ncbi:hypothetical protein TIFTF001_036173 [Ficus carica]|uniref:Uncharacterized protein n=1 Tax=Ficus carica TaxID=3494 RepID=A0AA88ECJ4_FICCA|nr:hypothetical protein TIFTF001_036173 [Ficus carica]